jgi:signal transduction histidine kinase
MPPHRPNASRLVVEAADRELRRLGQDLHDTVCQSFSGLNLLVRVLSRKMQKSGVAAVSESKALGELLQQAVEELHEQVQWANPRDFDSAGLAFALGTLARAASRSVPCELECAGPLALPETDTAFHLYHFAREAVRNAVRHSRAAKIVVRLKIAGPHLVLTIKDDGCGFDLKQGHRPSFSGLELLRHRGKLIGAAVRIQSKPGQGTKVSCRL